MKIVYIAPGFGGTFYCQNCVHSVNLAAAFKNSGHTAVIVPMYLPFRNDMPVDQETPIFYGAINVYVKEKYPFLAYLPSWIEKMLDSRFLLRWVSSRSGVTDPTGLEEMTISVMKGAGGKQARELERLIVWLGNEVKPDVVHCANALLIGIAAAVKQKLRIPVFCGIQDEDSWLDKMREPFSSQGWKLIRDGSDMIDGFVSASSYYAERVRSRAGVPAEKIYVVSEGIETAVYKKKTPTFNPPVIGYLSRMTDTLGLDILVDAFMLLKKDKKHEKVKLKISGGMSREDKGCTEKIKKRLAGSGFLNDAHIDPDLYARDKNAFFNSLTLLSVPARQGEAAGIFMLEAMASGIPVVQPDIGSYPEIIQNTNGGIVYKPNDAKTLAETLAKALKDPENIITMSRQGYDRVRALYTLETMRDALLRLYKNK